MAETGGGFSASNVEKSKGVSTFIALTDSGFRKQVRGPELLFKMKLKGG